MKIFGLYITRASNIEEERKKHTALVNKNSRDNSLWNKVFSKLLHENLRLKMRLGR